MDSINSNKRPDNMERITNFELANAFIEEQVAAVREQFCEADIIIEYCMQL